jgi:hypothetical protein
MDMEEIAEHQAGTDETVHIIATFRGR